MGWRVDEKSQCSITLGNTEIITSVFYPFLFTQVLLLLVLLHEPLFFRDLIICHWHSVLNLGVCVK